MLIASHEGGDTGKIAKMIMVHDIPESRTGDVDFDLFEQAAMGNMLREQWQEARRHIAKEKFYTKTAKDIA